MFANIYISTVLKKGKMEENKGEKRIERKRKEG